MAQVGELDAEQQSLQAEAGLVRAGGLDLVFRVWVLGFRVWGSGLSGFRVLGSCGLRFGCRVITVHYVAQKPVIGLGFRGSARRKVRKASAASGFPD